MDAPAMTADVKNINGILDKMSKTLVESSSTLVQLIEEMREIQRSQQFLSDQYEEMKKYLHSTDEEVKTLRIENQDPLRSRVCHFFCKIWKVCNSITHQANGLESCLNLLRIQQVLNRRRKKKFFVLDLGFSGDDITSRGVLGFFGQLYLALGPNPIIQYFGSRFFRKLGQNPHL